MRHGVLGAGGVGGLVGAALARAGREVVLVMRPESHARYDGTLRVESAALGDFEVDVPAATTLDGPVDVLWVTPKATGLDAALALVLPAATPRTLVPLLNGLDHVALLRRRFGEARVLPGVIYVESERIAVGRIAHRSAFAHVEVAPGEHAAAVCDELRDAGFSCGVGATEEAVLWRKLATLGPVALTTTALRAPLSAVMADREWRGRLAASMHEVAAAAAAEGVEFDVDAALAACEGAGDLRSSMQKDQEAGRPLELDAIGGAILRASRRHGLGAPATQELVDRISAANTAPTPS